MTDAMAVAAQSMAADMLRLSSISHNLANATTPAFKREILAAGRFAELLSAWGRDGPGTALAVPLPDPRVVIDQRAGPLQRTGNPLDLAVEGEGFFELRGAQGPLFTRQGSFSLDAQGRLVSASGLPVVGSSGDILLTTSAPRIDGDGRIYERDRAVAQLRIVRFDDPGRLTRLSGGLYAAEGVAAGDGAGRVRQGFVEASNVVTAGEMVRLIETMRHFEANQKVIQAYDGMMERALRTLGEF